MNGDGEIPGKTEAFDMNEVESGIKSRSLLVVSRNPWDDSQSEGNTLSNLFRGYPGEISHLCCRAAPPANAVAERHFSMSDLGAVKTIFNPKAAFGESSGNQSKNSVATEATMYRRFKRIPLPIFLLGREMIWAMSKWKSASLARFLSSVAADSVFLSVSDSIYVMRIAEWAAGKASVPLSVFIQDDILMRTRGPIDRIRRRWLERTLGRVCRKAANVFYITEELMEEYEPRLGVEGGRVLRKASAVMNSTVATEKNAEIQLVYVGNVGMGRLDTLLAIGMAIDEVCPGEASIDVYTGTEVSRVGLQRIAGCSSVTLKGHLPAEMVPKTLAKADVLLHVESLNAKRWPEARLSFSTKLADYFGMGKCILAVGDETLSSMRYLERNEAAVTVTSHTEMRDAVRRVIQDGRWREGFGQKAVECARRNHSRDQVASAIADI